ncbi:MAG: hypothetical protein LBQ83_02270 [Candidatus Margulisbacteria bacterium]|jgi:hypothetical protein|nr:hypothetical protein [Candidatus Margulisiibacteriota bacterium]
MNNTAVKSIQQEQRLIIDSINKALRLKSHPDSLSGQAKHIDYEISALLPILDNKIEFCKNILADLTVLAAKSQAQSARLASFLAKLKNYMLGKLFYLSLKENQYLLIKDFSSRGNKNFLLGAVAMIEASQENSMLFLDTLTEQRQKDFFIGMISCIYN